MVLTLDELPQMGRRSWGSIFVGVVGASRVRVGDLQLKSN